MESDSLDGPWTPIPASAIKGATMGIGGGGADAVLLAAVESAERVAASPIEKWNAMQAAQPGANHQRFHAGDVVSAADLAALRSAATLLRMAGVGRVIESLGAPDDNDTKSKTLPAVADEPTGPALTPSQSRVLKIMARFDRSQLVSTDRIVAEMDPARPLSDETVRLSVKKLIDSGLAERPEGDRSGARLTPSGRTLCGKIAD